MVKLIGKKRILRRRIAAAEVKMIAGKAKLVIIDFSNEGYSYELVKVQMVNEFVMVLNNSQDRSVILEFYGCKLQGEGKIALLLNIEC